MKQIDMLETIMYAIRCASTDELRDILMLPDDTDDTEVDIYQEFADEVWKWISNTNTGFGLLDKNGELEIKFDGEDNYMDYV